MFKCDKCRKTSKPRDGATKVVIYDRFKVYPPRYREDEFGKQVVIDKGGEGREIAKEMTVCPSCAPVEV